MALWNFFVVYVIFDLALCNFFLFLLGITSKWRNVLGIFYLQEFVVWFSCNRNSCGLYNLLCYTKPQSYVWEFSVCKVVYICCVDINVSVNVS